MSLGDSNLPEEEKIKATWQAKPPVSHPVQNKYPPFTIEEHEQNIFEDQFRAGFPAPGEEENLPEPQPLSDITSLLWVDPVHATIITSIYIYVTPGSSSSPSKINAISESVIPELVQLGLEEHEVLSYWTVPSRSNMEDYRRASGSYNPQTGSIMVDEIILSNQVIIHHLKDLYIDGKIIDLKKSEDNTKLLTKSLNYLKSIHSGFYDTLYTAYKSEACLIS